MIGRVHLSGDLSTAISRLIVSRGDDLVAVERGREQDRVRSDTMGPRAGTTA